VAYLEIGKGGGHKNGSEERKSSSWVQRQSFCGRSGAKPQKLSDLWNSNWMCACHSIE